MLLGCGCATVLYSHVLGYPTGRYQWKGYALDRTERALEGSRGVMPDKCGIAGQRHDWRIRIVGYIPGYIRECATQSRAPPRS